MVLELGIVGFALTPVYVKVSHGSGESCSYVGGLLLLVLLRFSYLRFPHFVRTYVLFMFTRLMRYMKAFNINVFIV
jgi:hypothetical protein